MTQSLEQHIIHLGALQAGLSQSGTQWKGAKLFVPVFLLGALAGYCGYIFLSLSFGIFCLFATVVILLLVQLVSVSSYSGVYKGYKIKITTNSGIAGNWWTFSLSRKGGFPKKMIKLPSEKKKCEILSVYEMQQGNGYSLPTAILDAWIGVPRSGGSIQVILSDGQQELLNSPEEVVEILDLLVYCVRTI